MCVFLFRSSKNDERKRERDKRTRVKRSVEKIISSSFLCKQKTQEGAIVWHLLFFFFSFLQNTNKKRSKNVVKIYMDTWI